MLIIKMTTYIPSVTIPGFILEKPAASILLPIGLGTAVGFSVSRKIFQSIVISTLKPTFVQRNEPKKDTLPLNSHHIILPRRYSVQYGQSYMLAWATLPTERGPQASIPSIRAKSLWPRYGHLDP